MICNFCGANAPDGTWFCGECGELLAMKKQGAVCPACGYPISSAPPQAQPSAQPSPLQAARPQQPASNTQHSALLTPQLVAPANPPSAYQPQPPQGPVVRSVPSYGASPASANSAPIRPASASAAPIRPAAASSGPVLGEFSVQMHSGSLLKRLTSGGAFFGKGTLAVCSDSLRYQPAIATASDSAFTVPMRDVTEVHESNVMIVREGGIQVRTRFGDEFSFIPNAWEKGTVLNLIRDQIRNAR